VTKLVKKLKIALSVSNLRTNLYPHFLSPPSNILRHFSSLPLQTAKTSTVGGKGGMDLFWNDPMFIIWIPKM
jgi:hypothetical protein